MAYKSVESLLNPFFLKLGLQTNNLKVTTRGWLGGF